MYIRLMKSLTEYIKEQYEEQLELKDAINYEQFSDLLMFLDEYDEFNERKQSICNVFRRSYSENITKENVKSSVVFKRMVDDLISKYNRRCENQEDIVLNVSTRKHLEDELAAKMLIKIRLEQEQPKPAEENEDEL